MAFGSNSGGQCAVPRGPHVVKDWTGGMFVLWPALKFSTVAVFGRAGQCRIGKSVVFGRPDIPAFVGNGCMELVGMRYLCENCDLEGRRHGLESECGYPGESEEMLARDGGYICVVSVEACSPVVPHFTRAFGRRKVKEEAEVVNLRCRS